MGKRIAHYIVSNNILDYLELSDEYSIVEIMVNREDRWYVPSLNLMFELNMELNIVAIKRGKNIIVSPQAEDRYGNG